MPREVTDLAKRTALELFCTTGIHKYEMPSAEKTIEMALTEAVEQGEVTTIEKVHTWLKDNMQEDGSNYPKISAHALVVFLQSLINKAE